MAEVDATPGPVDLVREAFGAGNRRDLDAIVGFHATDAVWDLSDQGLGVFEGAGAVRGWLEDWFGAWADLRLDVREIVDLGTGVVFACVLEAGRPAVGGGHVEQERGWVVLAEHGKLARIAIMLDAHEARAAAERLAKERR
jgi:ketosteroid isomerase-like protein